MRTTTTTKGEFCLLDLLSDFLHIWDPYSNNKGKTPKHWLAILLTGRRRNIGSLFFWLKAVQCPFVVRSWSSNTLSIMPPKGSKKAMAATGEVGKQDKKAGRGKACRTLPKAIQESLAEAKKEGVEMTPEALAEFWSEKSAKDVKGLFSGMAYEHKTKYPEAAQEYADATKSKKLTDKDRRLWIARFALNPESGGAKAGQFKLGDWCWNKR